MRRYLGDEVIVSTLPRRLSRWMAMDLPHRVRRATSVPVTHMSGPAGHQLTGVAVRETSSPAATRAQPMIELGKRRPRHVQVRSLSGACRLRRTTARSAAGIHTIR